MAEYYPLLAKAVGSLPNSTPESRRVVYERARKALIGQLRTLHPPVPDEDIERESVELDRAVERLETELADAPAAPSEGAAPMAKKADERPAPTAVPKMPAKPASVLATGGGALGPFARKPVPPPRPKMPTPKPEPDAGDPVSALPPVVPSGELPVAATPSGQIAQVASSPSPTPPSGSDDGKISKMPGTDSGGKPRLDAQRPIAPQPASAQGPKRRMWIIPAGIGLVVVLVGLAAWKLRDRPESVVRRPVEPAQTESGKIAERVGGKPDQTAPAPSGERRAPEGQDQAATTQPAPTDRAQQQPAPAASNPELPVAHRAALLIEAPDEPNKVKTFLGTVVWKLNNVSDGPSDAVGLGVEADIDLPDDKMKVVVTFEKNTDASLPASHTVKVRFNVQPGSVTGDVKQISVPQMRREDSPSGEPLAGVTVPVIQDSFLVGLSPGNAETANLQLVNDLQWVDIPMLLTSGKIAKLTFEKGASGQRDIAEALASWQKQ